MDQLEEYGGESDSNDSQSSTSATDSDEAAAVGGNGSADGASGGPRRATDGPAATHKRKQGQQLSRPGPSNSSVLPSAANLLLDGASIPDAPVVLAPPGPKRVRGFLHVAGDFATHVYFTVQVPEQQRRALSSALTKIREAVPGLEPIAYGSGGGGSGAEEPQSPPCSETAAAAAAGGKATLGQGLGFPVLSSYHVSLSRPVPIQRNQIERLQAALREALSGMCPFTVRVGGMQVFVNDFRNRSFVAVGICSGSDEVCAAIRRVDTAFVAHGLQPFHCVPRPHLSVAWVVGDAEDTLCRALQEVGKQQQQQQRACGGSGGGSEASADGCGGGVGGGRIGRPGAKGNAQGHQNGGEGGGGGGGNGDGQLQWDVRVTSVMVRIGQKVFRVWEAESE